MRGLNPLINITAILVILACAGYALSVWIYAPDLAKQSAAAHLSTMGLNSAPARAGEKNAVIYKELALDQEGFNTIDKITFRYHPRAFLLSRTFESIDIDGLKIIEDLTKETKQKDDSAWRTRPDLGKIQSKRITVNGIQVTLQTAHGGVSIGGDMIASRDKSGFDLQSALYLTHKNLRLKARGQGVWDNDGWWQHDFEIPEAAFQSDAFKMARAAGGMSLSDLPENEGLTVQGELQSDGVSLAQQSWKNAALSIEGTAPLLTALLSAKSSSLEGLDLTLTIPDLRDLESYSGTIFAENPETLKTLLSHLEDIKINEGLTTRIPLAEPTTLSFEAQAQNQTLNINIKNEEQDIDIKSESNDKIALISQPQDFKSSSQSALTLTGRITLKSNDPDAMMFDLQDTQASLGDLRIKINDGPLRSQAQTQTPEFLPCAIDRLSIDHSCVAQMKIDESGHPQIDTISLRLADGDLKINNTINPPDITATLISLRAAISALGLKDWEGEGLIEGQATLRRLNNQTLLQTATLKNHGPGVLKIKDDAFLRLLTADEEEQTLIHEALKNLHYERLKIDVQNIGAGQYRFLMSATGSNPSLMKDRKFTLSFDFESNLTAIKALLFNN